LTLEVPKAMEMKAAGFSQTVSHLATFLIFLIMGNTSERRSTPFEDITEKVMK